MKPELTAERLRELLHYDPDTGVFTRRIAIGSRGKQGDVAGMLDDLGYIRIGVNGKRFRAHQLAFLYQTGDWAKDDVDHIDGARSNNQWSNLRDVTRSVNLQNRRASNPVNKTSGLLGASWSQQAKKWWAHIFVESKCMHLGLFDSAEAAHAAYMTAKRIHHAGCTI